MKDAKERNVCESASCANNNEVEATHVSASGMPVCMHCYNRLNASLSYHKQARKVQEDVTNLVNNSFDIIMQERIRIIQGCESLTAEEIRWILGDAND